MTTGETVRLGPLARLENLRLWAEKATGIRPTADAAIRALAVQSIGRISPLMIDHLARQYAQQSLINGCVEYTMQTMGPQSPYSVAYTFYLDHARLRGLKPISLKTFKNRALARYGEDVVAPANIVPLRPYFITKSLFEEAI